MLTNAQFVKSKRSKLCLGLIQILEIPEEDDFRLLQGIGWLLTFFADQKCARIRYFAKNSTKINSNRRKDVVTGSSFRCVRISFQEYERFEARTKRKRKTRWFFKPVILKN